MAKVRAPAQSAHAKGAVGNVSYDRAGPLQVAKARAVQSCDPSAALLERQSYPAAIWSRWRWLMPQTHDLWRQWARWHPVTDAYCGRRPLSARQAFYRHNFLRLCAGLGYLDSPPTTPPMAYVSCLYDDSLQDPEHVRIGVDLGGHAAPSGLLEVRRTAPQSSLAGWFDRAKLTILQFDDPFPIDGDQTCRLLVPIPDIEAGYGFSVRYLTDECWATLPQYLMAGPWVWIP